MPAMNEMQVLHHVLDAGGYIFFLAPTTAFLRQELAKIELIAGAILMAYAEIALRYHQASLHQDPCNPWLMEKVKKCQETKEQGLLLIMAGISDFARAAIEVASLYSGLGLILYDYALSPLAKSVYQLSASPYANIEQSLSFVVANAFIEKVWSRQKKTAA